MLGITVYSEMQTLCTALYCHNPSIILLYFDYVKRQPLPCYHLY